MTGRPAFLLAPAGLAGCGAAIAVGGLPSLGALAGLGLGLVLGASLKPATRSSPPRGDELNRHLMRCRRRGEPAWVLVARVGRHRGADPRELVACFRLTDSVAVERTAHGHELTCVFDDGLDRDAVDRRLRLAAGSASVAVAWARFPDDGVTLAALLDEARTLLDAPRPAVVVSGVLEEAK